MDAAGGSEVVARVQSFPMCIDFLGDGRLLVVSSAESRLLRRERDGSLVTHVDLAPVATPPWNEVVVDGQDNAYVNNIGFEFPGGQLAPGFVALASANGSVRRVAEDLWFPNGMLLTGDGSTLIAAESYAHRLSAFEVTPDGSLANRRVWAHLGDGTPDGFCMDAEGAVWYADVPAKRGTFTWRRSAATVRSWPSSSKRCAGP